MTGNSGPVVAVCIPVWNAAGFVAETLSSVLAQQSVALRVHISVDGADQASRAVCEPFLNDPRVSIVVQPARLGWVRNCAAALDLAIAGEADYACIQPHDDIMEPDYLSSLLEVAQDDPAASVVYSDILAFGDHEGIIPQSSVAGSPLARMTNLLLDHFAAVAFRGLTRMSALKAVPPMTGNPSDDFAVDTVWMTRLATQGNLVRVPRLLYRKRYHAGNTHTAWAGWSRDRRIDAWTQHCIDMLTEAAKVAEDYTSLAMLIEASRIRLFGTGGSRPLFHHSMWSLTGEERTRVSSAFEQAAARVRLPNIR
jgi:GT2 family glycosyltransferase